MIEKNDASYNTFQGMLTGYRLSQVMLTLNGCGFFKKLNPEGSMPMELCEKCGWSIDVGIRFLDMMISMGLILRDGTLLKPTLFSQTYLMEGADLCQSNVLGFESRLFESWETLDEVLANGGRVFSSEEKSNEDYDKDLSLYIDAMDGAAKVRAVELWDVISVGNSGVIADLGAGSGLYLHEFLDRHPGWQGIFCDLTDVIRKTSQTPYFKVLGDRVKYMDCNLLDQDNTLDLRVGKCADVVLLSNLVHCQGEVETRHIISQAAGVLKDGGLIIVHDFFRDRNWFGALYDIHMMLNTYNGKTYGVADIAAMFEDAGINHWCMEDLPANSSVVIGSKNREELPCRP